MKNDKLLGLAFVAGTLVAFTLGFSLSLLTAMTPLESMPTDAALGAVKTKLNINNTNLEATVLGTSNTLDGIHTTNKSVAGLFQTNKNIQGQVTTNLSALSGLIQTNANLTGQLSTNSIATSNSVNGAFTTNKQTDANFGGWMSSNAGGLTCSYKFTNAAVNSNLYIEIFHGLISNIWMTNN